jgi:hypothetical protein
VLKCGLLYVTFMLTKAKKGGVRMKPYEKVQQKVRKKGYVTPRLIIHGSVEKITGGGSIGGSDAAARSQI